MQTVSHGTLGAYHHPPPPAWKTQSLLQTIFKFQRISEESVLKKLVTLDASLFNHSVLSGQFPSEWKEANVTLVPKSGDKDSLSDY